MEVNSSLSYLLQFLGLSVHHEAMPDEYCSMFRCQRSQKKGYFPDRSVRNNWMISLRNIHSTMLVEYFTLGSRRLVVLNQLTKIWIIKNYFYSLKSYKIFVTFVCLFFPNSALLHMSLKPRLTSLMLHKNWSSKFIWTLSIV